MKLEDIEIGMMVIDKYDNEYEVNKLTEDKRMPVKLKCTKFVREIPVQNLGGIKFREVGQSFYIYKSKKIARNNGNDANVITLKSLKLKSESNGIKS